MSILMNMNERGPRVRQFVRRYLIGRSWRAGNSDNDCGVLQPAAGADRAEDVTQLRVMAGKWPSTMDVICWQFDPPDDAAENIAHAGHQRVARSQEGLRSP